MAIITNRSELVFLYDTTNCNPNGDPMDANRPRINEETGKCLVTDVRLKRTIRDYLFEKGYNGEGGSLGDIFIRDEDGKVVTGTQRAKSYANKPEFIQKFIDVRLFGAVSAPKKEAADKKGKDKKKVDENLESGDIDNEGLEEQLDTQKTFHFTGAVQFGMGKSFNKVKEKFIKGTGAFATKETSIQRTFREEYNITYGLIGFHGVINENAAKITNLSEADVNELVEGMWNGTKNLLTRSKKGHMPRLLIKVDYSQKGFFIGDLLERLSLVYNENVKEDDLESIEQFSINTGKLIEVLNKYDSKISNITVIKDDRITFTEPIPTKAPVTYESISI
jgi:CRISPR-associated protein Csh2